MKQEIIIALYSSIPVWVIIGYLLLRTIKKRDQFENDCMKRFKEIQTILTILDKNIAIMSKDMEHAVNLTKTVGDLTERVTKFKYDMDNYFKRVRDLENKSCRK